MAPGNVDLYVGFTGVQIQRDRHGVVHSVEVKVGSNEESTSAAEHDVHVLLAVRSPEGRTTCTAEAMSRTTVTPPIQPLRFKVSYPLLASSHRSPPTQFVLTAQISLQPGTESSQRLGNNKHQWTFSFDKGGTPSCESLLK